MGAVDPLKDIEHYVQVMKAPRIRESAARLAEQARSDGWSHEDYLAAVLSREVTARESSGLRTGSDWPDFRHQNHWRSSTSTINRHSVEKWWHIWELESS
jgi:hypothetical protein